MNEAERVITDELGRYLGQSLHGKNRVMIPCPFHKETQPSLIVNLTNFNNRPVGYYYCFGCKASPNRNGGWNGLAKLIGLKQIDGDGFVQKTFSKRREKIKPPEGLRQIMNFWQVSMAIPIPEGTKWRGFPADFLNRTGALMGTSEKYGHKGVILPVYVGTDLVGAVFAAYDKEATPKYANSPGQWAKTDGVFMLHYAAKLLDGIKNRYIVITEGPRDCMRLLRLGIPAVAVLGANNWSETKTNLILMQDVGRIVLGLDNDKAGKEAANGRKRTAKEPAIKGIRSFFAGRCMIDQLDYPEWEKDKDPGAVSSDCLRYWVKKYRLERSSVSPKRSDFKLDLGA